MLDRSKFLSLPHSVMVTLNTAVIRRSMDSLRQYGIQPNGAGITQVEIIGVSRCRKFGQVNACPVREELVPQIALFAVHKSELLDAQIAAAMKLNVPMMSSA